MKTSRYIRPLRLFVIFICILVVTLVGVLHLPWVQDRIWTRVQARFADSGVQIGASSMRFGLFDPWLRISGFSLGRLGPQFPSFVTADEVSVSLSFLRLLQGTLVIEDASLDGVVVDYVVDDNGNDNWPFSGSDPASGGGMGIPRIESLGITGSGGSFRDARRGLAVSIPGWSLTAGTMATGLEMEIVLETGTTVDLAGTSLRFDELNAAMGLEGDALEIRSLSVVSDAGTLDVSGRVAGLTDPELDLNLDGQLSAQDMLRLVGVEPDLAGQVDVVARLRGRIENLEISSSLTGRGISAFGVDDVGLSGDAVWTRAGQHLQINGFRAESPLGALTLTADLALSGGESEAEILVGDADLLRLGRLIDLPVEVASRVDATIAAKWPGLGWRQVAGDAAIEIEPLGVGRPDAIPLGGSLRLQGSVDTLSVSMEPLGLPELEVRGLLDVSAGGDIEGDLDVQGTDAGLLVSRATRLFPGLGEIAQDSFPRVKFGGTVELAGSVTDPDVDFTLEVPTMEYGGLSGVRFATMGRYRSRLLHLDSLTASQDDQSLDASGQADFSPPSPLLDFETHGRRVRVPAVFSALGVVADVDGLIDFDAVLAGSLEAPEAAVELRASEVEAGDLRLGAVEATATVDPGVVEVTRVVWRPVPDRGVIDGSGRYEFSGNFGLNLHGEGLDAGSVEFSGLPPVEGRFDFDVEATGPVGNPAAGFTATGSDVAYGGMGFGEFVLSGSIADHRLNVRFGLPGLSTTAEADLDVVAPYPLRVQTSTTDLDVSVLGPLLPSDRTIEGSVSGEGRLEMDLVAWRDAIAELRLEQARIVFDEVEFSTDLASLGYRSRRVSLDPFDLTAAGQSLRIGGDLPLDPDLPDGRVEVVGDVDLASVFGLWPAAPLTDVRGTLGLSLELIGNTSHIVPGAQAALRDGTLAAEGLQAPLTEVAADISLADDIVEVRGFRAQWNGGTLEAEGVLPLQMATGGGTSPGVPARLDARVSEVPLGALPGVPSGLGGLIGLHVSGQAHRFSVEDIEARAELETPGIDFNGLEFVQELPIVVTLAGGNLNLEPFRISGPQTRFEGQAGLGLTGDRLLQGEVRADTDTLVLASASGEIASSGRLLGIATFGGTLEVPEVTGRLELEDAQVQLEHPDLEVADLSAHVAFSEGLLVLEDLSAVLNGGVLHAQGSMGYRGAVLTDGQADLTADGVFLEFPDGLQTFSNARIELRSRDNLFEIGGDAEIVEGAYTGEIALDRLLLDYIRGSEEILPPAPDPLLSRIRFDIGIDTADPIIVDNNVAQLEATANLQLVGSYYRPGLLGRISLAEGGAVQIQENRFLIDRGAIDFVSPNRVEPQVDIVARTEVRGESITLALGGGGSGDLTTTLSSGTGLSEPNIVSLLLTGRTLDKMNSAELNVIAQEQALSYITGSVGGVLSRNAQRALRLSRVRIEPNLIASESDPGARLTIGQDITRALELIYSMNLNDSGDQIWIAEYDFDRSFTTRGIRQDDNSYRVELRHDLAFGASGGGAVGTGPLEAARGRRVDEVMVTPPNFDGRSLEDVFGIGPGSRYDFFEVRKGSVKLGTFLADRGYLEARVRVTRVDVGDDVALVVRIETGPVVDFEFVGAPVSGDVREQVREAWQGGGFETFRTRSATRVLRAALVDDGYLEPEIFSSSRLTADGVRLVQFDVRPGLRYRRVDVAFTGARIVSEDRLRDALHQAGLWSEVRIDPERAREFLEDSYRARGFLDAAVGQPRYEFDSRSSSARLVFPVGEGAAYTVGKVILEGNARVSRDTLMSGLPPWDLVSLQWLNEAERHLEERYWGLGYNDVLIERSVVLHPETDSVDVVFAIRENERSVVGEIEIAGNRTTESRLARGQVGFEAGEPLDYGRLNESRRSIYQIGTYSLVEVDTEPAGPVTAASDGGLDRPVRVRFDLTEVPPYSLRYGGFYDNERGPGVIADLENHGLLGGARVVGIRTRYDGELRELRFYLGQPALRAMPFETNLTGFVRSEELPSAFVRSRGFSLQQQTRLDSRVILSYGYRFENTHTTPVGTDEPQTRLNVAPLTFSVSRDTRDDPLDASDGWFTSHAVEYAAPALASDLSLLRYFGQFFRYLPLADPGEVPFSGGVERSRVVFATGVRIGLVGGLGDAVVPNERFFAGGGTTIRGFREDGVGPLDSDLHALGGDALLIFNNEIRFPIFSLLEGVAFADAGNVYPRVGDFDLFDLRTSGGIGLRLRTPWFLLRADYGFNLNRRPDEKQGAFFFSIGQAF